MTGKIRFFGANGEARFNGVIRYRENLVDKKKGRPMRQRALDMRLHQTARSHSSS
jgi:hypothetical protein